MHHSLLVVHVLTITCIRELSGQLTSSDERLAATFSSARSGAVFRVRTTTGAVGEGALVSFDSAILTLRGGNPIPVAHIERVWEKGRAGKTGAIVGAVVGAGLGAYAGALGSGLCEGDCPTTAGAVTLGVLLGAAGGTVLGFGVGSLFPKWRLRFP